jgi:hypothetical protein
MTMLPESPEPMGIPAGTPIEIVGPPGDQERKEEARQEDRPYIAFG